MRVRSPEPNTATMPNNYNVLRERQNYHITKTNVDYSNTTLRSCGVSSMRSVNQKMTNPV